MPIWKLQCSFAMDTALPRDRMVITPHFNQQLGSDAQGLCTDLAAALSTWCGVTPEITVTAYDAQGSKPVYPEAQATVNAGQQFPSSCPREVALCLSFYGTRNIPRQRGRVYAPIPILVSAGSVPAPGLRPSSGARDKVGALATIFANLGGADCDWSVYSRKNDQAYGVTNWWVDDEWDTMRSRGLRSTTRTVGTVSEG